MRCILIIRTTMATKGEIYIETTDYSDILKQAVEAIE